MSTRTPSLDDVSAFVVHDVTLWTRRRRTAARCWIENHPQQFADAQAAKATLRQSVAGRQMYDGDPFAYGFEPKLSAALEREAIRARHRRVWLIEETARGDEFDERAEKRAPPEPSDSTYAAFVKHSQKFDPECVIETARDSLTATELATLELELAQPAAGNGKPAGTRRRRTTSELREQVVELDRRGIVKVAIADTLNISDRRVTEILKESSTSQNGGRKASAQAELFAD